MSKASKGDSSLLNLACDSPNPDPHSSVSAKKAAPSKKRRPQIQDGRLAECDNCGVKGTDLVMCFRCKHVFGPNINIVENPFRTQNRKSSSAADNQNYESSSKHYTAKQEVLEESTPSNSPPPSFISGACDSENDHADHRNSNTNARDSKSIGKNEQRIRILHAREYAGSIITRVNRSLKDKFAVFQAHTSIEDTVIEERMSDDDKPICIRIVQLSMLGVEQILEDKMYASWLEKIIFSCPSDLNFMLRMVNNALNLKSVRFGVQAFNLRDVDSESQSDAPRNVECKTLESLEMDFDRSKYDEYDIEGKETMRVKMSKLLQIASTAFPKLIQCDITIPDEIESHLDGFLKQKVEIKKQGCKRHNYKENTVRFLVQENPNKPKCDKKFAPVKQKLSCSLDNLQSSNVEVIDISDDDVDAEVPYSMISSASNVSNQSSELKLSSSKLSEQRASNPNSISPPEDWNDEQESSNMYLNAHIALCKCGAKSKNLVCCDKCNQIFPQKTKYVNDSVPQREEGMKAAPLSNDPTLIQAKSSVSVTLCPITGAHSITNQSTKKRVGENNQGKSNNRVERYDSSQKIPKTIHKPAHGRHEKIETVTTRVADRKHRGTKRSVDNQE